MRAPTLFPITRSRMRLSDIDDAFIARCIKLWDSGMDTKDISIILFESECIVESATRLGRERRRQNQKDQ